MKEVYEKPEITESVNGTLEGVYACTGSGTAEDDNRSGCGNGSYWKNYFNFQVGPIVIEHSDCGGHYGHRGHHGGWF